MTFAKNINETFEIHNRIHIYMLDAILEDALNDKLNGKGRSVAEQFAHIHNVRLMWLKVAAPELMLGLEKLGKEHLSLAILKEALSQSSIAIGKLLLQSAETGKIKGFKPHAMAFLGYLISHESHHRGHIFATLKHCGHPLDKKIAFGIWEWGVR